MRRLWDRIQSNGLKTNGVLDHESYNASNDEKHLESAISALRESVDRTPDGHHDKPFRINLLGKLFLDRYMRSNTEADLNMSIERLQEAFRLTLVRANNKRQEERQRMLYYLVKHQEVIAWNRGLDVSYSNRYELARQDRDSARLTDDGLWCPKAERARDAGYALEKRYIRMSKSKDLEEAMRKSSLRLPEIKDLEEAIKMYQEAVDLTPAEDTPRHLSDRLQRLGVAYKWRYFEYQLTEDFDTSVRHLHAAVENYQKLLTIDFAPQSLLYMDISDTYTTRYYITQDIADLETAIEKVDFAVRKTGPYEVARGARLKILGDLYHNRYKTLNLRGDLEQARQHYKSALYDCPRTPPSDRIQSGKVLMELYASEQNWTQAYEIGQKIVPEIPLLTPRSLAISDKQHVLPDASGLASDVAAIAIKIGKPTYDAIKLLEIGRGIISASLSELRADVTKLKHTRPRLAKEYDILRDRVNTQQQRNPQGQSNTISGSTTDYANYQAREQFEKLLGRIRKQPGFEEFLLPPTEATLMSSAASGPIIVINVSSYGCAALIVEKTQLRTEKLESLNYDTIREYAQIFVERTSVSINTGVLEWLWTYVAEPVLDVLGFNRLPTGPSPRVWWIPTGVIAKFPIHAAGLYSEGSHETVMDRVISSYSSSVRALIDSRQRVQTDSRTADDRHIVLVGIEGDPKNAMKEIRTVESLCSVPNVRKPAARRTDVISALRDCRIFHFAGHGVSDLSDPLKSALTLPNGEKPLTVQDLFDLNLFDQQPFMAYLSACSTGQIRSDSLLDEGIHLIGAFQLAGFKHVIGTLWEVDDDLCVEVARKMYNWILKKGVTDDSVSEGLHLACKELRNQLISESIRGPNSVGANEATHRHSDESQEGRRLPFQHKSVHTRDGDMEDDPTDDTLIWVPYVHFGS